jgi:hypothetical protein
LPFRPVVLIEGPWMVWQVMEQVRKSRAINRRS